MAIPDILDVDNLAKLLSYGSGGLTIAFLLGISRHLWNLLDEERAARLQSLEKNIEIIKSHTDALSRLHDVISSADDDVRALHSGIDNFKLFVLEKLDRK